MSINFQTRLPTKEQFSSLFKTTDWNREYHASKEELVRAVAASQFVACAYEGERLVGFGRVVTDGILHAMIYDMIVHPEFQRCGIGTKILAMCLDWCQEEGIRDIQLFCAYGKRPFYEMNNFIARPVDAPGMQFQRKK